MAMSDVTEERYDGEIKDIKSDSAFQMALQAALDAIKSVKGV